MTATEMQVSEEGRLPWEPLRLAYVGHVGDVLQLGGGKLTPCHGDPGEPRKPKGQEPPPAHPQENFGNNHPQHPFPCG